MKLNKLVLVQMREDLIALSECKALSYLCLVNIRRIDEQIQDVLKAVQELVKKDPGIVENSVLEVSEIKELLSQEVDIDFYRVGLSVLEGKEFDVRKVYKYINILFYEGS